MAWEVFMNRNGGRRRRLSTDRRTLPTVGGVESWHGTVGGYTHHRCGCDACREAFMAYQREYRAKAASR